MAVQAVKPARPAAFFWAPLLAALLAWPGAALAQTQNRQPSTFSPVIGAALLCHDQIDNAWFYHYLTTAFGPPYKHAGGAYWFRTGAATLWGTPVSEVMVSDDSGALVFLAAVADVAPDELEQAIRKEAGVRHLAADGSTYPLRISAPGSTIAYYNTKSKIYCAKFKPLPARR